jgi:hypothetical protein
MMAILGTPLMLPSNTKVSFFQAFATAVQPFRNIVQSTPTPNAFTVMTKLEQSETCPLHYAVDMCRALTDGLMKIDQVYQCRGIVTAADFRGKVRRKQAACCRCCLPAQASGWRVSIRKQDFLEDVEIVAPRLILCTGSSPTVFPLPVPGLSIERLDLDTVLKPSDLCRAIPTNETVSVAVVGASHSAIIALMNLVDLARTTHPKLRVKWFTRHPLRYAEFMDGWILRDNTGLKGSAAKFAKEQLEDGPIQSSEAGRFIEKIDCSGGKETGAYETHLPECSHIVYAVGFTRQALPALSQNGALLTPEFDHVSGGFFDKDDQQVIPGLYGAGIAFPERVVDPHGNVEYAVGFFKFMKFLKRVTPTW